MYLNDIRIVDMNVSKLAIDEKITKLQKGRGHEAELEKAKAEKKRQQINGEYEFIEKRYIDFKGDKQARPPYWFTWCRYEPGNNYLDYRGYKAKWNYSPVNMDEDNYWPDGQPPNAEGNYIFGDLILVKCPLIDYLRRKLMEKKLSEGGARAKLEKFHSDMDREGAAIPDAEMEKLLSDLK